MEVFQRFLTGFNNKIINIKILKKLGSISGYLISLIFYFPLPYPLLLLFPRVLKLCLHYFYFYYNLGALFQRALNYDYDYGKEE